MNPEAYASELLTDAYDDIHRAASDLELLMGLADAMRWLRNKMASGDCFFVRIERTGSRYFKATYHVEADADEGNLVSLVEFDPHDTAPLAPPVS